MESAVIAPWVAAGLSVIGIIVSGRHYTRLASKEAIQTAVEAGKEIGRLNGEIQIIKNKLEDPIYGLPIIKIGIDEQKNRCAGITANYEARLKNIEKKT